jgi:hypothetical protein
MPKRAWPRPPPPLAFVLAPLQWYPAARAVVLSWRVDMHFLLYAFVALCLSVIWDQVGPGGLPRNHMQDCFWKQLRQAPLYHPDSLSRLPFCRSLGRYPTPGLASAPDSWTPSPGRTSYGGLPTGRSALGSACLHGDGFTARG